LIFTSRASEKTDREPGDRQHVVPLAIVHGLDPTCIPPPRADGVPVWGSDRVGEILATLHVGDAETVRSKIDCSPRNSQYPSRALIALQRPQ
jgi:hypothetical protein